MGRTVDNFQHAAVIGAGLMGRRIAGVLARGGLDVRLFDVNRESLAAAVCEASAMASEGSGSAGSVAAVGGLADAVSGVDLVIEAVVEDLQVKQDIFSDLERHASASAVLATNSSVLRVADVGARVRSKERVVGMHWWNPPDLIPIVEVVQAECTGYEVVKRTISLLEELGKSPVHVRRDTAGFIGNRLQHALWREAFALVSEGIADAQTVDLVVRQTIGLRLAEMGPLENADYVGLDLTAAIHRAVLPALSRASTPDPLISAALAAGNLGAKTGQGIAEWPEGNQARRTAELSAHIGRQLRDRG